LQNAFANLDPDGGTAYLLFRKDRIVYRKAPRSLRVASSEKPQLTTGLSRLLQFGDVREFRRTVLSFGISDALPRRSSVRGDAHLDEIPSQ
jgi:hypothetical protein